MYEAFIQNTQNDIYGDQRGQNQQGLIRQRISERCRCTLEIGFKAGRHVHVLLQLVDGRNGTSEGSVRSQVERHSDCRKLSLMRDRERLSSRLEMRECAERNGTPCRRV